MREVVDGSNSRFIDPEKPEQLAAELECFFADSSLAEEMGVRAAKTIKERFSPVVIEKQVKDVYSEVIQNAD
jgi:glycosyltransferase involved in cell wall biosynthesis